MATLEEKNKVLDQVKELLLKSLPGDHIDYLIAIVDHSDNIDVFASTGCARCIVDVINDSLDSNNIGHIIDDKKEIEAAKKVVEKLKVH